MGTQVREGPAAPQGQGCDLNSRLSAFKAWPYPRLHTPGVAHSHTWVTGLDSAVIQSRVLEPDPHSVPLTISVTVGEVLVISCAPISFSVRGNVLSTSGVTEMLVRSFT